MGVDDDDDDDEEEEEEDDEEDAATVTTGRISSANHASTYRAIATIMALAS